MNPADEKRYDSKPTCTPDCGSMSWAEQDALFNETLEREDVAERVWIHISEGLTAEQSAEIVRLLFRRGNEAGSGRADSTEAGRLLFQWLHKSVHEIVEKEEMNT
jgi:hypothetical protein